MASGELVLVDDVVADPRYLTTLAETRSEIVVPVRVEGRVRGLIDVESDEVGGFTDEDCGLLEHCAELLAPLWGTS